GASPRNQGFFDDYLSLYELNNGDWQINPDAINPNEDRFWTFASEVSQYSPYGAELENRDALNRYSAAQYSYNYTLPTSVASNSRYREIGFDGFEDYTYAAAPETVTSDTFDPNSPINQHFSFLDEIADNGNFNRTAIRSHTGRFSVAVNAPGQKLVLERNILDVDKPPRDTCITNDVPICNDADIEIEICNQSLESLIVPITILGTLNYGSDGPATVDPITIVDQTPSIGNPVGNQFANANVSFNNTGDAFIINLNEAPCQFGSGQKTFAFEYQLEDSNGDTATCIVLVTVRSDGTDCSTCNAPSSGQLDCNCN
ncbi:MAG: hypothetical protein HRT68_10340, partial [Flavobacteriaceae bacterium]|nr:hypothetical protein [Flavobacteriaceae bacterium]